jgi:hypothetical protein
MLKWPDITDAAMENFVGLSVMMGKVWKDNINDCWLTDATNSTPVFSQAMSMNHFEKIWEAWHSSND